MSPCVTIINLERALRKGRTPGELGAQEIGNGEQNTAYLYKTTKGKKYVIKSLVTGWRDQKNRPPARIKEYGARFAFTYRAGSYVIQEVVTPLRNHDYTWNVDKSSVAWQNWSKMYSANIGDLHEYNCGVDSEGNLVVFDW